MISIQEDRADRLTAVAKKKVNLKRENILIDMLIFSNCSCISFNPKKLIKRMG